MNINNKQPYFKSAVAFFFLFFLHGTSIGNGQQGISYNSFIYEILSNYNGHNYSNLYFDLGG